MSRYEWAQLDGFGQFRPICAFAAFNLGHVGDYPPSTAIKVFTDCALLGFESQSRPALSLR